MKQNEFVHSPRLYTEWNNSITANQCLDLYVNSFANITHILIQRNNFTNNLTDSGQSVALLKFYTGQAVYVLRCCILEHLVKYSGIDWYVVQTLSNMRLLKIFTCSCSSSVSIVYHFNWISVIYNKHIEKHKHDTGKHTYITWYQQAGTCIVFEVVLLLTALAGRKKLNFTRELSYS